MSKALIAGEITHAKQYFDGITLVFIWHIFRKAFKMWLQKKSVLPLEKLTYELFFYQNKEFSREWS